MDFRTILFGGEESESQALNIGLLLPRLFSGLAMAFGHGIGKVPPSDGFVGAVAKLGFPLPEFFAWAAGGAEFFGGILLAVGLLTRPSAFFLFITMAVAGFVRHAGDPFAVKEKALLYAAVMLLFVLVGAGKYSLDAVLRKRG